MLVTHNDIMTLTMVWDTTTSVIPLDIGEMFMATVMAMPTLTCGVMAMVGVGPGGDLVLGLVGAGDMATMDMEAGLMEDMDMADTAAMAVAWVTGAIMGHTPAAVQA